MPLGIFPALLVLAVIVTLASAYYLLINARSVASVFRKSSNEIAPGPGVRTISRGRVHLFLGLFTLGTIASIALWTLVLTGAGNEVVESRPAEVQRP